MPGERMQDAVEGRRNDVEHGASYEQLRLIGGDSETLGEWAQ